MAFTCPECGKVSYNPNDEQEGYCGACQWWTGDPAMAKAVRLLEKGLGAEVIGTDPVYPAASLADDHVRSGTPHPKETQ